MVRRYQELAKRGLYVVCLTLAALGPVLVRVKWEGDEELQAAREAHLHDDFEAELVHLGRAARWYLPGSPTPRTALAQLIELGDASRNRGAQGLDDALRAYREARGAIFATRTWDVDYVEDLGLLNHRIAQLMAEQEARLGTDLSGEGRSYEMHLELLNNVPAQRSMYTWAGTLVFFGWLGGVYGLAVALASYLRGGSRRRVVAFAVITILALPGWLYLLHVPGAVVPP